MNMPTKTGLGAGSVTRSVVVSLGAAVAVWAVMVFLRPGIWPPAALIAGLLLRNVLAADITSAEEREIALWILRLGGQVMVDGVAEPISDPFQLPAREFRIKLRPEKMVFRLPPAKSQSG